MTRVVSFSALVLVACGSSSPKAEVAPRDDTLITQPVPANPPPAACTEGADPPGSKGDRTKVKVGEVFDVALTGMTPVSQTGPGVMGAKQLADRFRFIGLKPGASDVYVTSASGCIAFAFEVHP